MDQVRPDPHYLGQARIPTAGDNSSIRARGQEIKFLVPLL